MPAAQAITAAIEFGLNSLLERDKTSAAKLSKLKGKQFKVTLSELPFALVFAFAEQVHVLSAQKDVVNTAELNRIDTSVDCSLSTSIQVLPELQDSSQLTALIQQGKLSLQGDIHIAQSVSQLFMHLDIDWEAQLAMYTGDVPAHLLFRSAKSVKHRIQSFVADMRQMVSEGAIEEKPIAAAAVAVAHYCDQVDEMRADVARLEARLSRLEQAN